jgi:ribosome-associated protein
MADEEPQDEPLEPTRTKLREQAEAFLDLAEELAKGKHTRLPDPPFDAELRAAIDDAQRMVKKARPRQIRRLAQLLREAAPLAELRDALAGRTPALQAGHARDQRSEAWRAQLLERGDAALDELVANYPNADRTRLRQLMRQASRTPPDARSKRAATSLFRAVRVLLEAADAVEPDASEPEAAGE